MVFCSIPFFAQQRGSLERIDSIKKRHLNAKIQDSTLIAKAHYEIGEIYRYGFLQDSAYYHYYKAEKIFRKLNANYYLARTLYGIQVIQNSAKDYTGSEVTAVEAISLLDQLQQTNDVKKYKSFIFNNMGLTFSDLGEYKVSLKYYKKALDLKEKLKGDNSRTIDNTKTNVALTYKISGQYDLALEKYSEILENKSFKNERPDIYPLVLDFYAHTLFMSKNHKQLPGLYFNALKASDSIKIDGFNTITIYRHLAEYYDYHNQKDSAKYYAYKAKSISEKFQNETLLESLLVLSEIEDDSIAVKHYNVYIKLNDSLHKIERSVRNKFARIRFETKEIEKRNVQISRQKIWLLILSGSLLVGAFLIYIIISQRSKNKELKFVQHQQETNEEIYNLMLSQQDNIDEARVLEKKRISEELHDGVLGRLFGTRLSLDSLNMGTTPEAIKTRGQYIGELKTIEQEIRKVSHDLNTDFVSVSRFKDIIKALVKTQTFAYGLKYKLIQGDLIKWDKLSNKTKIHIYRIIQETMHNIYKHAQATQVKISFKQKKDVICLTIKDDGSGFDINKAKKGIGLKNINSRVHKINGDIKIHSEKDKGTSITINIPT